MGILALSYPENICNNNSSFFFQSIQIHVWTPHWNVRPSPLVTGHSFRLDARDVGLTDAQLNACRVCMGHVHVEAVDLEVQSSKGETVLGFGDVFALEMVVVDADSANGIWYCRMNLNDPWMVLVTWNPVPNDCPGSLTYVIYKLHFEWPNGRGSWCKQKLIPLIPLSVFLSLGWLWQPIAAHKIGVPNIHR